MGFGSWVIEEEDIYIYINTCRGSNNAVRRELHEENP
jgi:hypothetical protein